MGSLDFYNLKALIRKEPKKAAALVVLVVFMGGLWVWRLGGTSVPTPSIASVAQAADVPASVPANVAAGDTTITRFQEWAQKPVDDGGRNLFVIRMDYYPRIPGSGESDGSLVQGFWSEMAKSVNSQADQRREKEILVENLRHQAGQLRLQSTIMGQKPKAMVNGKLVEEGDVVEGFRVLKIGARGIIVERDGIRIEVLMK
ncbi:MAG: hypothetical protein IT446_14985 [Phycisphaerales bacterium]|nr:hypothetical protein [Phycisphaerales bacterium]